MEEAPELISPRISFSHDLAAITTATQSAMPSIRSDRSLMSRRLAEPEFDFANAAAADVAPADRLFADGKLLPVPPLPLTPSSCKDQESSCAKPQACQKRPARSWTSPFSRSSSVNSTATTAPAVPRSTSGRFGCPSFPLMRSRSAGSAAAAATRDGLGSVVTPGHRTRHKKVGTTNGGGGARSVYYYGGGRNGNSSHGVRVSPVLNVTSIGTSVVNLLSYLLCDCGDKTTKISGLS